MLGPMVEALRRQGGITPYYDPVVPGREAASQGSLSRDKSRRPSVEKRGLQPP